jgi:hypothetical protein
MGVSKEEKLMSLHPVTDDERKRNNPKRIGVSKRWTICELLRTIYIKAESRGDEETMRLAHDSLCYAKRMNAKLKAENRKYAKGWFHSKKKKKQYL